MPDDELLNLAARGELRKQLPAQVKRMLADPRSENLARNFTVNGCRRAMSRASP
jgi:hypothetical protein